MTAKGHMLISIPISVMVDKLLHTYFFGNQYDALFSILFYSFVIIGSVLPDIDEPESYIGRKFPVLSYAFSIFGALTPTKTLEHRGITHYLIVPLVILYFAYTNDSFMVKIVLYSLAIGIFAHDCGDMLTKGGIIGFFFPLFPTKRIGLLPVGLRFITNSTTEWVLNFFIFIGIVIFYMNSIGIKFF